MTSENSSTNLRELFKVTADRLLESLATMSGPYMDRNQLPRNTLAISTFDAEDNEYLESSDWLFRPMSQDRLRRYPLDRQGLDPGGDYTGFEEFKPIPNPTTILEQMEHSPGLRARILEECFRIMFIHWHRKLIRKTLIEKTGWKPVVVPNPFLSPLGLLNVRRPPGWSSSIFENVPGIPHIMLLAVQDVSVTENEMLVGELGPIVQAIRNRLGQEDFTHITFFPVLMVSLSGPQHGRITQGCFDRSGKLQLRMSRLYSFMTKQEAPFDLFLRFLSNEPQEHPDTKLVSVA